jgi:hypothetical protein
MNTQKRLRLSAALAVLLILCQAPMFAVEASADRAQPTTFPEKSPSSSQIAQSSPPPRPAQNSVTLTAVPPAPPQDARSRARENSRVSPGARRIRGITLRWPRVCPPLRTKPQDRLRTSCIPRLGWMSTRTSAYRRCPGSALTSSLVRPLSTMSKAISVAIASNNVWFP